MLKFNKKRNIFFCDLDIILKMFFLHELRRKFNIEVKQKKKKKHLLNVLMN